MLMFIAELISLLEPLINTSGETIKQSKKKQRAAPKNLKKIVSIMTTPMARSSNPYIDSSLRDDLQLQLDYLQTGESDAPFFVDHDNFADLEDWIAENE